MVVVVCFRRARVGWGSGGRHGGAAPLGGGATCAAVRAARRLFRDRCEIVWLFTRPVVPSRRNYYWFPVECIV